MINSSMPAFTNVVVPGLLSVKVEKLIFQVDELVAELVAGVFEERVLVGTQLATRSETEGVTFGESWTLHFWIGETGGDVSED